MSWCKIGKIIKKSTRTGEIVMIYPNIEVAAREEGVSPHTIKGWCNGYKKTKCGYKFESEKEEVDSGSLCWKCQKYYKQCSWTAQWKPVEGWVATRNDIRIPQDNKGQKKRYEESYMVHACPEFVPDPPRKNEFPWMTEKCVECASLELCAACGPICRKRRDW